MNRELKHIQKILIANRGEIAVRIMRTAKRLAIKTVAIYDSIEKDAMHVRIADESYALDTGALKETYLNIHKIISIAKSSNCDAIHPGYGFLSENENFAKACYDANIKFIGPDYKTIKLMGNKIEARKFAESINVPISLGIVGSVDEIKAKASLLTYPILVKAAAGGGGKGMKIANSEYELHEAIESASREAKNYFGNHEIYVEQYFENPRHIEVQILGDEHGHVIHLYDRECSIQRRYQKIIEEAPSPTLNNEIRNKICATALQIGKELGYKSAGTIEFLVDDKFNYYFLEMNTRIQVEHPVTEMITGIDIVEHQIKIANGNVLELEQSNIKINGHAIECRIYAEDTDQNFLPAPGYISYYNEPQSSICRVDSSIDSASEICSNFDPMISKVIVSSNNRENAISSMIKSLKNYDIHGIKTNINYLQSILTNVNYKCNQLSTQFIDNKHTELIKHIRDVKQNIASNEIVAGFIVFLLNNNKHNGNLWNNIGLWRDIVNIPVRIDETNVDIKHIKQTGGLVEFLINDTVYIISQIKAERNHVIFQLNSNEYKISVSHTKPNKYYANINGCVFNIIRNDILNNTDFYEKPQTKNSNLHNKIVAPMPGKVVKIDVKEGQKIKKGTKLIVIEAMKMENTIIAHKAGKIKNLNVRLNDSVSVANTLLEIV